MRLIKILHLMEIIFDIGVKGGLGKGLGARQQFLGRNKGNRVNSAEYNTSSYCLYKISSLHFILPQINILAYLLAGKSLENFCKNHSAKHSC